MEKYLWDFAQRTSFETLARYQAPRRLVLFYAAKTTIILDIHVQSANEKATIAPWPLNFAANDRKKNPSDTQGSHLLLALGKVLGLRRGRWAVFQKKVMPFFAYVPYAKNN